MNVDAGANMSMRALFTEVWVRIHSPDTVQACSNHLLEDIEPEVRDGKAECMKLAGTGKSQ